MEKPPSEVSPTVEGAANTAELPAEAVPPTPENSPHMRRNLVVLVFSNLLAGVGVASGAAVGALLAESLGGTSMAGLAQAVGVLAAAVASIPLATLAQVRGRRWALSLGYVLSTIGALLIVTAAVLGQLVVLLVGLTLYGVANATNLQSRYAAADNVGSGTRARTMSIVLWSTTVGSVVGPNLAAPGAVVGSGLGVPALGGPYLFSVVAYLLAGLLLAALYRDPAGRISDRVAKRAAGGGTAVGQETGRADGAKRAVPKRTTPRRTGALAALRWAWAHPRARFAVVTTAAAHSVMIMVMVMTPVHMQHGGMSLQLVGIVISLHVLGMFALSPVFGWLADRFGPLRVAVGGLVVQGAAVVLGFAAAALGPDAGAPTGAHAGHGSAGPALDTEVLTAVALVLLGLGWSACVIASSAVLASVAEPDVKLPLQGATDALMNYFGAGSAALAGPLLAWGGFQAVNTAGAVLLVPAVVVAILAARRRDQPHGGQSLA